MSTKPEISIGDFSLTRSGLFYKLVLLLGLGKPSKKGIMLRALVVAGFTWLPLLILSALQGMAFGDAVEVTFLKDFAIHTRFLITLPLLIYAEGWVDFRLKEITSQFFKAGILTESDLPAFKQIKEQTEKWSRSVLADLVILFIIVVNLSVRYSTLNMDSGNWFFLPGERALTPSWAGLYFIFCSMTVLQFILLRWMWRWVIWVVYFNKLSKLPLKLNPAHPDLAGGIGFLGFPPGPFLSVILAMGILLSATIAKRIVFFDSSLPEYYSIMIGFALISVIINVLPLLVFIKPLFLQRRKGFFEYSALIQDHHRQFDEKWLRQPYDEPLPGTGDASSLTDFNTTFDVVKGMRIIPFDLKIMFSSILFPLLPMLPLLAFEYNLLDVLRKIIGLLL